MTTIRTRFRSRSHLTPIPSCRPTRGPNPSKVTSSSLARWFRIRKSDRPASTSMRSRQFDRPRRRQPASAGSATFPIDRPARYLLAFDGIGACPSSDLDRFVVFIEYPAGGDLGGRLLVQPVGRDSTDRDFDLGALFLDGGVPFIQILLGHQVHGLLPDERASFREGIGERRIEPCLLHRLDHSVLGHFGLWRSTPDRKGSRILFDLGGTAQPGYSVSARKLPLRTALRCLGCATTAFDLSGHGHGAFVFMQRVVDISNALRRGVLTPCWF